MMCHRSLKLLIAFAGLKSIDLGYNKLTVLPADLTSRYKDSLKTLILWNNLLVALPPDIGQCTSLTDLKVRNLTPLHTIILWNNFVVTKLLEIAQCASTTHLQVCGPSDIPILDDRSCGLTPS